MVVDKSNMKQILLDFPKQCRDATTLAKGVTVNAEVDRILVCGMGGSAIGGDILASFLRGTPLPVHVTKDYHIPAYVDEKTLVFAVSYSGNTEETLSALTEAKNKGATVVGITSGGKLADMADTAITVPTGLQPRNAVGYLFFPIIGVLYNSHIIDVKNNEVNEMLTLLEKTEVFMAKGEALAKKIKDRVPIIYASTAMEAAAYRFKCEINENAKHPAWHHVFPELCHNELVGLDGMERSKQVVIMIRSPGDHPRIQKRMDITKGIFEERVDVEEVKALGDSLLARLFSVIYLGDWTSYYLALWKRVDPTPVYVIENLKKQLTP